MSPTTEYLIVIGLAALAWLSIPRLAKRRLRQRGWLTAREMALSAAGTPAAAILILFYGTLLVHPSPALTRLWWLGMVIAAFWVINDYPVAYYWHQFFFQFTRETAAAWRDTHDRQPNA